MAPKRPVREEASCSIGKMPWIESKAVDPCCLCGFWLDVGSAEQGVYRKEGKKHHLIRKVAELRQVV